MHRPYLPEPDSLSQPSVTFASAEGREPERGEDSQACGMEEVTLESRAQESGQGRHEKNQFN